MLIDVFENKEHFNQVGTLPEQTKKAALKLFSNEEFNSRRSKCIQYQLDHMKQNGLNDRPNPRTLLPEKI